MFCNSLYRETIAAISTEKQPRKHIRLVEFRISALYVSHLLHRFKSFFIYNSLLRVTIDYPTFFR